MLAEQENTSLRLVHVIEPVAEAFIDPRLASLMRAHQVSAADKLAEWCRSRTDTDVELEVVKGSPAWELAAAAKSALAVVVGSSTVDAFTVGPVAKRVARKAVGDTLIVRRQPRVPYRRVVAAVDFSEASRLAVQRAMELFPDAELTAVFSLPSRFDPMLTDAGLFEEEVEASRGDRIEAAKDRMAEFALPWRGELKSLIVDGPPVEMIDEVVRRRNADLVVVGSRGATATRMVLLGTVAEGLIGQLPCDVLVARSPAQFRRP